MSATIGTFAARTISFSAAVASAVGQDTRTMSAPASSQRRIWSIVAFASSVGVLVMVWTLIGASPPTGTEPTMICRDVRRIMRLHTRYYAFLSYSHKDKELADWLHRELERFRVPRALRGRLTANGVVPKRLTPIFRDEHDLAAAGDLGGEIKATLAVSQ